jgi:hypothetical protein
MKTKTYAVLTRDWSYTNMIGETITWKKGRRFLLTRCVRWDRENNLVLEHWYGFGCDEVIPAKYFRKK